MLLFTRSYSTFWLTLNLVFLLLPACGTKEKSLRSNELLSQPIENQDNTTSKTELPKISLIKPTQGKHISSEFGMRSHPIKRRQLLHTGIDISGKRGDKIIASANGTVVFCGRRGSYGLTIDLDIGNGVILRYAHLDRLHVKKGVAVCQGQCIGKLGRTGRATAPHLHFEVRVNNIPVDPMQFIIPTHHWTKKPQQPSTTIKKEM